MADTATEETTQQEQEQEGVDCPTCGKTMKNDHGLDIHMARAHKKSDKKSDKKKAAKRSNGLVASRVWLEDDELHIEADGKESVYKLGRPSIVVDLYQDTKHAAQDYVDSLSF